MSFTPNIPTVNQSLGQTQQSVLDNFAILRSTLAVNHNDVNAAGNGKHKYVQMPSQGSAPATTADEIATYTKGTGALTRIFMRQQNNGAEVQLSGIDPFVDDPNRTGYTFLPGGLLLIFGTESITTDGSSNATITFPNGLVTTNRYSVVANCSNSVVAVRITGTSSTGFTVGISNGLTTTLRWMAIVPQS